MGGVTGIIIGLDKICLAKFEQSGQPEETSNSASKMDCKYFVKKAKWAANFVKKAKWAANFVKKAKWLPVKMSQQRLM